MRFLTLLMSAFAFLSGIGCGSVQAQSARAELRNAEGEVVATATFTQAEQGVKIALEAIQLSGGDHAFHIHGVGQCEPPDFSSAGPHFNPFGKKHGVKNPEGAHAGDLPNLVVGPDGTGQLEVVASDVTLREGENSLFHPEGTALVIHASPDDDATDPAGNAGARIACGVITQAPQ
jgi:Cu-Zn family superoxide dismutase